MEPGILDHYPLGVGAAVRDYRSKHSQTRFKLLNLHLENGH